MPENTTKDHPQGGKIARSVSMCGGVPSAESGGTCLLCLCDGRADGQPAVMPRCETHSFIQSSLIPPYSWNTLDLSKKVFPAWKAQFNLCFSCQRNMYYSAETSVSISWPIKSHYFPFVFNLSVLAYELKTETSGLQFVKTVSVLIILIVQSWPLVLTHSEKPYLIKMWSIRSFIQHQAFILIVNIPLHKTRQHTVPKNNLFITACSHLHNVAHEASGKYTTWGTEVHF